MRFIAALLLTLVVSSPAVSQTLEHGDSIRNETSTKFARIDKNQCDIAVSQNELRQKLDEAGWNRSLPRIDLNRTYAVIIAPGFDPNWEGIELSGLSKNQDRVLVEWERLSKVAQSNSDFDSHGDYFLPLDILVVGIDRAWLGNRSIRCSGPYPY